jgi:hypothetical protein
MLIRSDKVQQYAGVYLLQNYSTCFGRPSRPSSGVHKIVTAASGTGRSIWATTFRQRGLIRPYFNKIQRDATVCRCLFTAKLLYMFRVSIAEFTLESNFLGRLNKTTILIRSNEMQQYADVYLRQNYSTCFGRLSRPSSGVHQIVTAASVTGHSIWATTFRQRGLIRPHWQKIVALIRDMTCTRSCCYILMYAWWWVW